MRLFAVALLALLLTGTPAEADFTPPKLVSGTQRIQFDQAGAPAISADGRYVVFQGSLAGTPGIYRRDMQTGAIEQVAGGDAAAPSVSADGRYIAFTTTADLEPEGAGGTPAGEPARDAGCPEVYVRDMGPAGSPLPASAPGAYTLVAALNGSDQGIGLGPCPTVNGSFAVAGAQAAPAVAMSADGRHVVFTLLSPSDLAGGTAGGQVAVRDLDSETTTLVTVTPQGEPTPGGGAFPSSESEAQLLQATALSVNAGVIGDQVTGSTAAISADASTVAWLGTNVPLQVPSATDVAEKGLHKAGQSPLAYEVEPLWRRVEDGSSAVTKRLLAGAGLDFYLNIGQEGAVDDGSFVSIQSAVFIPPVLSADGRTVAMIANAPTPAGAAEFFIYGATTYPDTDAYVAHVEPSPGSEPTARALTVTPTYSGAPATDDSIYDIAMSPDGTRVAFDTLRSQFDLPSLAFASPPDIFTGAGETYEANLALDTLQRVSSTYNGSSPNGDAQLLALTNQGALAFASEATNLFYGDGIPGAQVYLTSELPSGTIVAPQEASPQPNPAPPSPEWTLSATANPQADGSILVHVRAPGAGELSISAGSQLPVVPSSSRHRPRKSASRPGAHSSGAPHSSSARSLKARHPLTARRSRTGGKVSLVTRAVAQAHTAVPGPSDLSLRLRVDPSYRAIVAGRTGLYAILRVSFAAPGRQTLIQQIPVTFRVLRAKARGKAPKAKKARKAKG